MGVKFSCKLVLVAAAAAAAEVDVRVDETAGPAVEVEVPLD